MRIRTRSCAQSARQAVDGQAGGGRGARAQAERQCAAKRKVPRDRPDVRLQGVPRKCHTISGGYGWRDPPVPIPNTEVKPPHADGTWLETARESRSLPDSTGCWRRVIFSNIPIIPLLHATPWPGPDGRFTVPSRPSLAAPRQCTVSHGNPVRHELRNLAA